MTCEAAGNLGYIQEMCCAKKLYLALSLLIEKKLFTSVMLHPSLLCFNIARMNVF